MKKIFLMLAMCVTIFACRAEKDGENRMVSTNQEFRSYCVGRNVIDIPKAFVPASVTTGIFRTKGLSAQEPSFEVVVRRAGLGRSQFATEIRKREAELKSKGDDTTDILRVAKTLSDNATLFRVQQIDDAYISEIDMLRGSNFITVTLESYKGKFLAAEESLIKFAESIKESDSTTSGTKIRGFCLGPVVVLGEFADESGGFLFRDGKGSNFDIAIDTYRGDASVPLLARTSGPDSLLTKFDVHHKVLRARERTVAGMRAQEWLAWANLGDGADAKAFGFTIETMRPNPGKATPSIQLSFDTAQPLEDGTPTKTLVSDAEAIQLWDAVVNSLRPATG